MDDAGLVRGLDSGSHLRADADRFLGRDRTAFEDLRERLALDEFHHQVAGALVLFESVDTGDVGVRQRREQLGLALEARHALGVLCKVLGQRLDGDGPVELGVASEIDNAHTAAPELALDRVRTDLGGGEFLHEGPVYRRAESVGDRGPDNPAETDRPGCGSLAERENRV